MTRDLAKLVWYEVGKDQACIYLTSDEGWMDRQFDGVDWDRLYISLGGKPDDYKMWLAKQHTGHGGKRVQMGIIQETPIRT